MAWNGSCSNLFMLKSGFAVLTLNLSLAFSSGCAASEASVTDQDLAVCPLPTTSCETETAPAAVPAGFDRFVSRAAASGESPHHRGHDLFLRPNEDAWAIAKFAYGARDLDIKGEDVDVYLSKGCTGGFQKITTVKTTRDGEHETVEDVEDSGGRVYVNLGKLPVGRHRVHFVLKGDASRAEAFIEVLKPGQKVFVTDIDGTLTTSEYAEVPALVLERDLPDAHPDASKALNVLAKRGYRPFYLTARPEALDARTREFLAANGFPPGIVRTTQAKTGALGSEAKAYKAAELAALASRGMLPSFAIGNKASDAEAFTLAGISNKSAFLYQRTDDVHQCRRFEAYGDLLSVFRAAPKGCQ
jgi:phosphatidate phosphatase PAH1